jgi:histone H3
MSQNSEKSFKTYVLKVIKSLNLTIGTTKDTVEILDDTFKYVTKNLVEIVNRITIENNKKTITLKEAISATDSLFHESMRNDIVKNGNSAVETYNSFESKKEHTKIMKQDKAGLILSVSLVESYMRSYTKLKIGCESVIYLTSAIETFMKEFLNTVGSVTLANKRVRINNRDLFLGIHSNFKLEYVIKKLNIVYLDVGTVPGIDKRILESYTQKTKLKRVKKDNSTSEVLEEDEESKKKWRPGTVALREIKSLQKSTENQLCKSHVKQFCLILCKEYDNNCMMSDDSRNVLHSLVERDVLNLFIEANKWCLHTGRTTLSVVDINQVINENFMNENYKDVDLFTDPSINRIAKRAGVYRVGKGVCDVVRTFIYTKFRDYISTCVRVKDSVNKKIINTIIIKTALSVNHNVNLALCNVTVKRRKKINGENDAENDVENDEENEDLLEVEEDLSNE